MKNIPILSQTDESPKIMGAFGPYAPEEVAICRQNDLREYLVRACNSHAALVEALKVMHACGEPAKVSLYDEEAVDGWRWSHPDGREWEETGDHGKPAPMHPLARAALAAAKE